MATRSTRSPAPLKVQFMGSTPLVMVGPGSFRAPTPAEQRQISAGTFSQVDRTGQPMTAAQTQQSQQQALTQQAEAARLSSMTQQQQMADLQARQRAEAQARQQTLNQQGIQAEQQRMAAAAAEKQRQTQAALAEAQRLAQQRQAALPVSQPGAAPVRQPVVQLPPQYTQPVTPPTTQPAPARPAAPVTQPAADAAWEDSFARWKANNAAWQQKFLANQRTAPVVNPVAGPVRPQPVPQPLPQPVPQPLPQPVPQPLPQPTPVPVPAPVPQPPPGPGDIDQTYIRPQPIAPDPFAQFGDMADRVRNEFETAKNNRYVNDVNNAYYSDPTKWIDSYGNRYANSFRYEDWIRANRPDAVANNYGRNYAEMIGPEQQAYNEYVRSQNQNVYDQYAQYQNKAFNDYYATVKPGTSEYDRYNPYIPRPQTADIRFSQQDALGMWQAPRSNPQPGQGFNEWYNTTYKQPGYQSLSGIERTPVEFTNGFNFGPLIGPVTSIGPGNMMTNPIGIFPGGLINPAPLASGLVLHNQGNTN